MVYRKQDDDKTDAERAKEERDRANMTAAERADADERAKQSMTPAERAKADVEGKEAEAEKGAGNLRTAGVSNTKPDEAIRGAAENKRLQENPPPLVHVDPSTGKPIDKPFDPSGLANAEPNQLTTPGNPGVQDARPNNGKPT